MFFIFATIYSISITYEAHSVVTASANSSSRNVRQFLNAHLAARVRLAINQDRKPFGPNGIAFISAISY